MGFQVSPGVIVTERDLTTIVPAVSTSVGAFAGVFQWGPVEDITLLNDENQLVKRFGKPDALTASSFFTCANFLGYGSALLVVRVCGDSAKNATAGVGPGAEGVLIKNDDAYENAVDTLEDSKHGVVIARHPGALGNSIKVSICPSAAAFKKTITGVSTVTSPSTEKNKLTGDGLGDNAVVGSLVRWDGSKEYQVVERIDADTILLNVVPTEPVIADADLTVRWEFADVIGSAPGTSDGAEKVGGSNDELHVVVVDADGKLSGIKGTILERFAFLSKASDAMKEDGSALYYPIVLNRTSQYVRWANHLEANWGSEKTAAFTGEETPTTVTLQHGEDDNVADDELRSARILGYDLFANADEVDVSLILLGEVDGITLPSHVIQNICEVRKDCVAFISPRRSDVVQNPGEETEEAIGLRNLLPSSSYAVMDNNWKLQFDKYNDVERWVPLNGDIAGLCARTDKNNDPWWSPAGYNRGNIKNVIRLAYNPTKAERDALYVAGINPVLAIQGQGTVLFGDKTMLAKPSAFDRINVRRLFIVLEKAIATAAKFMLFEFNDEFTRQQFKSLVEPFLRDVQGRRGIYDFKVVCDKTNNTAEVIDRNEFIGDIYIKPARAINFIQLNFVAVRTGVDFTEVVGKA